MSMGQSGSAAPLVDAALAEGAVSKSAILLAAARSLGVVTLTLVVYGLMPIRPETAQAVGVAALVCLVIVGVVFTRQLGRVARSPRPVLAAVEALCLVFGMFLTMFAFVYVSMSSSSPGSFTAPIDKVAGIYFSVTVLATVGFGDIAALSNPARILVTMQMLLDLVLIGVTIKLLGISARRGVAARLLEAGLPDADLPAELREPDIRKVATELRDPNAKE